MIENRDDFEARTMSRANTILVERGSNLATAARSGNETTIEEAAKSLGQSFVDTLMDTFDGLMPGNGDISADIALVRAKGRNNRRSVAA